MYNTGDIIKWGSDAPNQKVSFERRIVKETSPLAQEAILIGTPETPRTKKITGCVSVLLDRMEGKALIKFAGVDEASTSNAYWGAVQKNIISHNSNFIGCLFTMKRNQTFYQCRFVPTNNGAIIRLFVFDSYFKLGAPKTWFEMGRYIIDGDECWLEKPNGELIPHMEKSLHINYVNNSVLEAIAGNPTAKAFLTNWVDKEHGSKVDKLVPDDIKAAMAVKGDIDISSSYYHRFQIRGTAQHWDWCLFFDDKRMYKFRYNRNLEKWVSTHKTVPANFIITKKGKTGTILDRFTADSFSGYNLELGLKSPDFAKYTHAFQLCANAEKMPKDVSSVKKFFGLDGKLLVSALQPYSCSPETPVRLYWAMIENIRKVFNAATTAGVDAQTAITYALFKLNDSSPVSYFANEYFAEKADSVRYLVKLYNKGFGHWHDLYEYWNEYRPAANHWEDLLVEKGFKSEPKYFSEYIKPSHLLDAINKAHRSADEWHEYCYNLEHKEIDERMANVAASDLVKKLTSYDSDEFCFRVPVKSMNLVKEGTALDHCVGRMNYNRKVASGKSIILFLREKAAPDKPFYTIELCPDLNGNWFMHQCYTFHDGIEKTESCKNFIDTWLAKNDIPNFAVY